VTSDLSTGYTQCVQKLSTGYPQPTHSVYTGYPQVIHSVQSGTESGTEPPAQTVLRLATEVCRRGHQSQRSRLRTRCRENSERVCKEKARGAERHSTNTLFPIPVLLI